MTLLRVHGLRKGFSGGARPVLDGASLSIDAGEVVGLVGTSGGGKSTLARCIAGLLAPDAGSIVLGDEPLGPRRSRSQRRRVQYVWQEPTLALSPWRSALQSVIEPLEGFAIGLPQERAARAAQALAVLGIDAATAARRPQALSGGQNQRVTLARALVAEPEVLLLDEPFSALDLVTTVALIDELAAAWKRRPCAVLLVSHDREACARLATRVLRLDAGRCA
jgi:peptide/nickel transport system ATP-binding protein